MSTNLIGDCIEWNGRRTVWGGYGVVSIKGKERRVHRLTWSLANGPIPEGLCILHRCDNPPCVNPKHLFLGTKKDNTQDMVVKGRATFLHHACKRGHLRTPENTRIGTSNGRVVRVCRVCARNSALVLGRNPERKAYKAKWYRANKERICENQRRIRNHQAAQRGSVDEQSSG